MNDREINNVKNAVSDMTKQFEKHVNKNWDSFDSLGDVESFFKSILCSLMATISHAFCQEFFECIPKNKTTKNYSNIFLNFMNQSSVIVTEELYNNLKKINNENNREIN